MYLNMEMPIPILRIFDEEKAKEFYLGFLEFKSDWEHRFEENTPLYTQISKNNCIIHLSEHYGDSSPGATLRISTENLSYYQERLISKKYKNARPGIQEMPWGTRDMKISDPFANKLIFTDVQNNT